MKISSLVGKLLKKTKKIANTINTKSSGFLKQVLDTYKQSSNKAQRNIYDFWKPLNNKQKDQLIDNFKKSMNKSKTLANHFAKVQETVNRITTKLANGGKLSNTQQSFLKRYSEFFVNQTDKFVPINSTWILEAKYLKNEKKMLVTMIRGKMVYPFFNVPIWVWVHLTTLPAHAGKYWWDNWLWKYAHNSRYNFVKNRKKGKK